MKRFFTFLMTTLVLLAVSTQGAKAFEYWIMGDLAQTSGNKWIHANCKANDANKFTANGSIWTYTFTAEISTVLYFRIAAAEGGYKDSEMLYPKDNASFTMSEETTYGVGYTISTDKSWGINVTAGQSYEITLDETDVNNRKISYKKAAAQVKFALNIDGAASSENENTDGKFSLDLTSAAANKTITFTVNDESYGLSTPATVSAAGTTTWSFENGKTNALTLSKGLSYALTLTPNPATYASAASASYTLTVVATLPTFDDYYMLGRVGNGENWSDNSTGLKFTSTDGKIYTRSVLCTADNNNFAFRIGTSSTTSPGQYRPNGKPYILASGGTSGMNKTDDGDNYWNVNMEANHLYTFTLDLTDTSNPTLALAATEVSGEYEMVATCGTETLVLPLSQARQRNSGSLEKELWTVGFKDDLLKGNAGDVFQVYIRDKKANSVQFRPAATTSGYGNFDKAMGNSQVEELGLEKDYTNLKYFGNAVYADPTSGSVNTFSIKKGDGQSYMLMLNLGTQINRGGSKTEISFAHAAKSVSLVVYGSLSEMYKKQANSYGKEYDEKTQDFYVVGTIYTEDYKVTKVPDGTNSAKMVRQIYYNPTETNKVDSIVYSKIVKRKDTGFNDIFMSFVPDFFYDKFTIASTGSFSDGGNPKNGENPFNYIARAATFDEHDATASYGTVMVRGKDENEKYSNGNQAINPLFKGTSEANKAYYIVRFNVTTSTYRIEFVDEPELYVGRLQTFCNTNNLKLGTGMHAYAVQTLENVKEGDTNSQVQGTLELRSLKYIPANEGVVLYVEDGQFTGSNYDAEKDSLKYKFEVLSDVEVDGDGKKILTETKEDWWKGSYADSYHNCLVASLFGTTIENGTYNINPQGKYEYTTRNFALNKFFNTKYYKGLSAEEKGQYTEGDNYWGFFRAKGRVRAGRAYLRLTKDELSFNGQFLDNKEDDEANFAKMSLFFDDLGGDITGIQEVNSNVAPREDGAYYTLQGMKVEKPVKGLYIHNGKKVIIK